MAVAHDLRTRALALARDVLPSDVRMQVTRDTGATADEKVDELLLHLLLAIVTVVGLVAFALGWREGLVVALAVPITFALTLLVNLLVGFTINRVTLFALVLSLGLVCDDPIVDVENIHRHFARRRLPPLEAVLEAVNEVRPPVIVATLAVILSFLPLLFITGMMGPYMRPMALNVPVAMAMSLLVAFTVTPWMSYLLLRSTYGKGHAADDARPGLLERGYRGLVSVFLDRGVARVTLYLGMVVLLAGAGALVVGGHVPLKMLPYDNKSELQVVLDLPEGRTLEATDRAVRDVEQFLATVPEVTDVTAYVGEPSPVDFNGLVRRYEMRHAPHLADVRLNLAPKHDRTQQSHEIALRLRPALEAIARRHEAALKLVETPPGPPVLATLVAEVRGPADRTSAELVAAARRRRRAARRGTRGVVDVDEMAATRSAPRLDFVVDQEKAALHGVSTAEVVRTLRLALSGEEPATVHDRSERSRCACGSCSPARSAAGRGGARAPARRGHRGRPGAAGRDRPLRAPRRGRPRLPQGPRADRVRARGGRGPAARRGGRRDAGVARRATARRRRPRRVGGRGRVEGDRRRVPRPRASRSSPRSSRSTCCSSSRRGRSPCRAS